jgi:hypothetical protein
MINNQQIFIKITIYEDTQEHEISNKWNRKRYKLF